MAPVGFPPDGETPFIGSNVFICGGSSSAGAFQGAFQLDDPVPNSLGCRFPNPSTGSCSCPGGSTQQKMRVLADNAGASFGSNIAICVDAPLPSPDMVTICSGVTADKWVSCHTAFDTGLIQVYFFTCPTHPLSCSTGQTDAAGAINACVAAAASSLALPAGTYLIASAAVDVAKSGFTLTTAGVDPASPGCGLPGASPCAILRAAPGLAALYGVLR